MLRLCPKALRGVRAHHFHPARRSLSAGGLITGGGAQPSRGIHRTVPAAHPLRFIRSPALELHDHLSPRRDGLAQLEKAPRVDIQAMSRWMKNYRKSLPTMNGNVAARAELKDNEVGRRVLALLSKHDTLRTDLQAVRPMPRHLWKYCFSLAHLVVGAGDASRFVSWLQLAPDHPPPQSEAERIRFHEANAWKADVLSAIVHAELQWGITSSTTSPSADSAIDLWLALWRDFEGHTHAAQARDESPTPWSVLVPAMSGLAQGLAKRKFPGTSPEKYEAFAAIVVRQRLPDDQEFEDAKREIARELEMAVQQDISIPKHHSSINTAIHARLLATMGRLDCRSNNGGHSCELCNYPLWCNSTCQREKWATHVKACEESRKPKPPRPLTRCASVVYVTPPPNAFGSILLENWHNKSASWRDVPLAHVVGLPLRYAAFDPTEANSTGAPYNCILSIFHTCFDTNSSNLFHSPDMLRGIVCFGRSDGKTLIGQHLKLLQMFITGAVQWVQQSPTKEEADRRLKRTFRKEAFRKFWVELRRMKGWWDIDDPFEDEADAVDRVPLQLTPCSLSPLEQQTFPPQQAWPPQSADGMNATAMDAFNERGRMLQQLPQSLPYASLLDQSQFAPLDTFSPGLLETSISMMGGAKSDSLDNQALVLQPALETLSGDPYFDQPASSDRMSLDLAQQPPGVSSSDTFKFFDQGCVSQQYLLSPPESLHLDQFAMADTISSGFSAQPGYSMDSSTVVSSQLAVTMNTSPGSSCHKEGQPDTLSVGFTPQSTDAMGTSIGSPFHHQDQQTQHCDYLRDFADPTQAMETASRRQGVDEVPWLPIDDEFVWEPFQL
ncbi:hypothetical protein Tdes44962_MAKER09346 [Teratosphaeria destructans]|uniref:MYND-type domain-containing protein n=1 Tax=Teratosphaeria destructans TaxID=418781 RepID=A0A9W7STJ6_9PEZI|nr:hypothetical protein Tdes44962_MAKER09346 [Teratosphaeria destructans]